MWLRRCGLLKLAPLIPYLQLQAEEFAREHPEPLEFGSPNKAEKFSKAILQRPVDLSGPSLSQRLRAWRTESEF